MGWLFGKKKKLVPKVPLPAGKIVDEKELRFPSDSSSKLVIEPDKLKKAAGIIQSTESKPPEIPPLPKPMVSPMPKPVPFTPKPLPRKPITEAPPLKPVMEEDTLFVKINAYKGLLQEISNLKENIHQLNKIHSKLEKSELMEGKDLNILNSDLKTIHDRLQKVDKTIFQGG